MAGRTAAAGGWTVQRGESTGERRKRKERRREREEKWVGPPNRSNLINNPNPKIKHPEKIIPE